MISPWLFTTEMCNMRCEYCYVGGRDVMRKDVYDAITKLLPQEQTHMRIAGGEPMLVYHIWKDWCLQWKQVEVLTNFRVVPDGYFDLPVRTSISIDGYGEKILDKELATNIARLRVQPWIMTTIFRLGDLPLLAYYIATNNYGWSISTDYFSRSDLSRDDVILAMGEAINVLKAKNYNFKNFNFNNLDFYGNRGGCNAGDTMFSIDCDGTIYTCQACKRQLDRNVLGNVFDGYETNPCRKEHKVCEGCSIKSVCTQWCPMYFDPEEQSDLCDVMKFVTREVLYAK